MIIKFDKPILLEKARETYSDCVKFITTTESYPNVFGVEFDCNPRLIFKKDTISPKVTKQINKIIKRYENKITRNWNRSFKTIKSILTSSVEKQESFIILDEQKQKALSEVDSLYDDFETSAEKPYTDAFKLGKMRGQVLSDQEIDDTLMDEDNEEIKNYLLENKEYLSRFGEDTKKDLIALMDLPYEDQTQLEAALETKVQKPKKARALLYAMAVLGLLVAGTIVALKQAKEERGERVIRGGVWTSHPDEGMGGEVCEGCLDNIGKWFDLDDFWDEYQNNNCLNRCRCDLRYMEERIAP